MEKIFDKEVEKYLKESGVSDKEISKIKYNRLKEHGIKTLNKVVTLLENDQYDAIEKLSGYSYAGDDYGDENNFIDFSGAVSDDAMDIIMLCEMLKQLKNQIQ